MDTPTTGPEHTKRLVELLTLALSSSEVGKTLKPETIRQFVQFRLRDVFDGKTLDLGPLWTALLAEPGLSEFKLAPPFLQIKEWEPRMATTVALPGPLASLDRSQAQRHLVRITVKGSDLDPLLYPALPQVPEAPPPEAAAPPAAPAAAEAAPAPAAAALAPGRKAVLAVSAVVAVAAFAFAGVTLFARPGSSYRTEKLDAILKLTDARRVSHSLTGVIADHRWDQMSAADRAQALEQLFKAVEADGVQSLILRDASGNSRAVASSVGGERSLRVE